MIHPKKTGKVTVKSLKRIQYVSILIWLTTLCLIYNTKQPSNEEIRLIVIGGFIIELLYIEYSIKAINLKIKSIP